ncbi:MAG: hypothetical protein P9L99_19760 [Candidatus Lernaella stagnicola]|nr:hypothetical protein [Candidatus Lernaella stagnicola]
MPRWQIAAVATILVAVALFHAGVNLIYLPRHALPDEEEYGFILGSIHLAERFKDDPGQVLKSIWRSPHAVNGANLHAVAGALAFRIYPAYRSLLATSTFFMLITLLFMFLVARDLAGWPAGLMAFVFASFFPVIFVWSRLFYCDVGLMMVATVGCFFAVRSEGFTRLGYAAAYGAWLAITPRFGWTVSDAMIALMAVGSPSLPVFLKGVWGEDGKRRRRALVGVGIALALFLIFFDHPWLFKAFDYLRYEGVELAGTKYAGGNLLLHPESVFAYLPVIYRVLASPAWSIAFLLALPLYLYRPSWKKITVLFWLALPLMILSLVAKKNINYVHALVPAMALVIAVALSELPRARLGKAASAIAAALVVVAVFQFSLITFYNEENRAKFSLTRLNDVQRFFEIRFPLHFVKRCQDSEFENMGRDVRELVTQTWPAKQPLSILLLNDGAPSDNRLVQIYLRCALSDRDLQIVDPHDLYMNFLTQELRDLAAKQGLAQVAVTPLFTNAKSQTFDLVIRVRSPFSPGCDNIECEFFNNVESLWSDVAQTAWQADQQTAVQKHIAAEMAAFVALHPPSDKTVASYFTCNRGGSIVTIEQPEILP